MPEDTGHDWQMSTELADWLNTDEMRAEAERANADPCETCGGPMLDTFGTMICDDCGQWEPAPTIDVYAVADLNRAKRLAMLATNEHAVIDRIEAALKRGDTERAFQLMDVIR